MLCVDNVGVALERLAVLSSIRSLTCANRSHVGSREPSHPALTKIFPVRAGIQRPIPTK